ncbi:hypothetical protein P43SY_009838 [Pythium insidiosum]|uniref:General transcription factor IIH subunit 4 n=1 Tax=Pythium insidiosum TaxID=114742 RepID=A0AAD5LD85_PYTIN|nr:hypothetical protein P43SY_009838 [Pythium insidiosum]
MDVFEFLETLPSDTLDRLYEDAWVCQAVFQSLPPLAQQFVMRLLAWDGVVPLSTLEEWIHPLAGSGPSAADGGATGPTSPTASGHQAQRKMPPEFFHALQRLTKLRVFSQPTPASFQLSPRFQRQLRLALSSLGGSPWETGLEPEADGEAFSPLELERFSRSRWDAVLHFMVGSTAVAEPPQSVVDILLRTRLMRQSPETRALHITDTGYEFMLKDVHVQLWIFLLEYIRTLDRAGALQQDDILRFLMQLSYCKTNAAYPVAALTPTQKLLLGDFTNFGLLYRHRLNSARFYTTSLAVNLVFGGRQTRSLTLSPAPSRPLAPTKQAPTTTEDDAAAAADRLQVIVETNFKVYAYTTSTLHVAMLSVFVDIVARLPNLAVGFITRESLRSALIHGISAQQIYDFLVQHAHPRMRARQPILPENIADQIYLWERERNRVRFVDGWLFDGFTSKDEFEQVLAFARAKDCVTWSDAIHCKLAISAAGIDDVRHFVQHTLRGT